MIAKMRIIYFEKVFSIGQSSFFIILTIYKCFIFLANIIFSSFEVPKELVELHLKLMRKIGKSVTADRWEKYLIKVQILKLLCLLLKTLS